MRVALVGPEIEENLALRYLASSLEAEQHEVEIFDFHDKAQVASLADAIAAWAPDIVGLSMIFTVRSREFMALARTLRALGFAGHITAGGHFAALHANELLAEGATLDSVVLGEGERPMVELARHLEAPERVRGIAYRAAGGRVSRTEALPNSEDLDDRPWPKRPDRFHTYLGQPIANLLSSRGCYATCAFCSISAFHRQNGGPRFRQRAARAVAEEMAHLYHDRGVRIFNFQDDNFLEPSPQNNLERLGALAAALRAAGVGRIGIQAKGRPDCIHEDVIDLLVSMGLFRLFLGVETDAVLGLRTLGRGMERAQNHRALAILRRREIHTCFNLLIFDPESTMESVRQNLDFMRRQSYFPLNFCRVEVYSGTPLEERLREEGRLIGNHYAYSYAIRDARVQRAYEIFREVFWARNFGPGGMHHESMKLDYNYHVLRHFYSDRANRALERRVKGLVLELNRNSADLMDRICDFAEASRARGVDSAACAAFAEQLTAERAAFDEQLRVPLEQTLREIEALVAARPWRSRLRKSAVSAAAAAALLATAAGCGPGHGRTHMCEMAPPPPGPVERRLGGEELGKVQAMVQERVETDLAPILDRNQARGVQLSLTLNISSAGRMEECFSNGPQAPAASEQLCNELLGMEFPFLRSGEDALYRATIQVGLPLPMDDTHMCEMAPAPLEPDPEPSDDSSGS